MKKTFYLIILILGSHFSFAQEIDSNKLVLLRTQIEQLDNQVKEIRRDELNYRVEKNLIKDTYSNNYDRISLVITIVLGIIGLFGYLGLKDINSIKKEYGTELTRLNELKTELENKIKLVSDTQIKYEKDILEIIKQNEEQNRKIKSLESIGKIQSLRKEKKYAAALEECLNALTADPNNVSLLMQKGLIYSITRSYSEAVQTYTKILEIEPDNTTAILNLSEAYVLNNQSEKAHKLLEEKNSHFNDSSGKEALRLITVLEAFNSGDTPKLINEIRNQIDNTSLDEKKERFENWNLQESFDYVEHTKESKIKTVVKMFYDYANGKISGNELIQKLNSV